jgi:hypothetical protein
VDTEQIQREMKATRASIDRKLDALSVEAGAAKQDAVRRGSAAAMIASAAILALWWWRRPARSRRPVRRGR